MEGDYRKALVLEGVLHYTSLRITPNYSAYHKTSMNMGEPREHYAKLNKPITERQILHYVTYMKYLIQSYS